MAYTKRDSITIILLLAILVIAAVLTYYPHFYYQFPLLVDEWYHITMAQVIARTGSIPHFEPYTGHLPLTDLESGYHYLLALIVVLFRPPITAWTYLPTILECLAVLSVFFFVDRLFGRKEALVAALLIALLPTNVTIGGPVFLIPENLGLIFIPLALLFAFQLVKIRTLYNYIGLFLITVFLLYAHPPTALVLLLILGLYVIFLVFTRSKDNRRRALYIFLTILLAVIASAPNYLAYLEAHGSSSLIFGPQLLAQPVLLAFGITQSIFFLIGLYVVLKYWPTREIISVMFAMATIVLIIEAYVLYGVSFGIPYQRTYIPLFLLMSIIASAGYTSLLRLNSKKKGKIRNNLGYMLLAIALIITCYFSIANDLSTPYYHLISQQDYQNFLYIKTHFNSSDIAIMNPYTARAYTPITGMHVYVVEPFGPTPAYSPLLNNTDNFFAGNCSNTKFLEINNISIVYSNSKCVNANLTQVTNDTYILNAIKMS